jgi:hypothetical protein
MMDGSESNNTTSRNGELGARLRCRLNEEQVADDKLSTIALRRVVNRKAASQIPIRRKGLCPVRLSQSMEKHHGREEPARTLS